MDTSAASTSSAAGGLSCWMHGHCMGTMALYADTPFCAAPSCALGVSVLCTASARTHPAAAGSLGRSARGAFFGVDACLGTFCDPARGGRSGSGVGDQHRLAHAAVAARNFFVLDGLSVVPWARCAGVRAPHRLVATGGVDGWAILAFAARAAGASAGAQSVAACGASL